MQCTVKKKKRQSWVIINQKNYFTLDKIKICLFCSDLIELSRHFGSALQRHWSALVYIWAYTQRCVAACLCTCGALMSQCLFDGKRHWGFGEGQPELPILLLFTLSPCILRSLYFFFSSVCLCEFFYSSSHPSCPPSCPCLQNDNAVLRYSWDLVWCKEFSWDLKCWI